MNRTPGIQHLPPSGRFPRFPKGGWELRYRTPDNATRRRTFETKQDALDFQAAVRTDKNRGDWLDPRRAATPFRLVAEEWYGTTSDLKAKTRQGYRRILDAHVLPALGDRPIGRITPSVLRAFVKGLSGQPATKRNIFRTLRPIFKIAVVDGMLRADPSRQVDLPRAKAKEMKPLTAEQVRSLAEAIAPEYRALVYFAAYTGCRAGEVGALRVRNLDLLRGRVRVEQSVTEVSKRFGGDQGSLVFGTPKNGEARSLAIPKFLVEMLAAHLAGQPHEPDDFVFPGARRAGREPQPLRHGNFYARHFKPAVRKALPADLHDFRFHDLRHTAASLLIKQGVHPKAIQERLGHKSITTTMNIYGHLYDDHEAVIMDGLEVMFRAASGAAEPEPLAQAPAEAP